MQKKNYIVESMYDKYANTHRLDEARNPENDKINRIIKKYEGEDFSFDDYSSKERALLKKYGIKEADDYYELVGPSGRRLRPRDIQDFDEESYGDFDFANYLATKYHFSPDDPDEERFVVSKSGSGEKHWPKTYGMGRHEHRIPADNRRIGDVEKTGKYGHYDIEDGERVFDDDLADDANYSIKNKDRISRMSQKQFDALQPYAKEKEEILKAGKRAREAQKTIQNARNKKKQAENMKKYILKSIQDKKASLKNESLSLKEDTKSALDLYCDDISNEELNGYGRISSLTDAQVKTLLSIAKAVSNKYKVKSLISLPYNTRKDLQNWTKAATQSGVDSKVFNDYAKNVMYAYDELNESLTEDMNTTIVTNIVDWLADHETAWEDCCNYFGVDPDSEELYNVDKDELLDWVSEHKQLSSDLLRHWGGQSGQYKKVINTIEN